MLVTITGKCSQNLLTVAKKTTVYAPPNPPHPVPTIPCRFVIYFF